MSQLLCRNLTLGYGKNPIVENLDFAVEAGQYLCIVGENGAGKSTLMRCLLGLQSPISGTIQWGDGIKQTEIGYLPQQTIVQKDFPASVREIVLSGCQNKCGMRPFYNRAEKQLAEKNMERLNITSLSSRCYRELSGGQQQRVLLARAMCAAGKIFLLDEPTAGLDPNVTEQMYNLIAELNKKDGITVIMISHDISSVLKYATNILHIQRNPFFGTVNEYIKNHRNNPENEWGTAL